MPGSSFLQGHVFPCLGPGQALGWGPIRVCLHLMLEYLGLQKSSAGLSLAVCVRLPSLSGGIYGPQGPPFTQEAKSQLPPQRPLALPASMPTASLGLLAVADPLSVSETMPD